MQQLKAGQFCKSATYTTHSIKLDSDHPKYKWKLLRLLMLILVHGNIQALRCMDFILPCWKNKSTKEAITFGNHCQRIDKLQLLDIPDLFSEVGHYCLDVTFAHPP